MFTHSVDPDTVANDNGMIAEAVTFLPEPRAARQEEMGACGIFRLIIQVVPFITLFPVNRLSPKWPT